MAESLQATEYLSGVIGYSVEVRQLKSVEGNGFKIPCKGKRFQNSVKLLTSKFSEANSEEAYQ
jgi:hypothetical protein